MRRTLTLLSLICVTALGAKGQAPPAAPAQAASPSVSAELATELSEYEKKVVRLAEAIPAEKYAWRPAEGVRSIGEVITHVLMTNYSFPGIMGVRPPAGVDVGGMGKLTEKDKIVAELKISFEYSKKIVGGFSETELNRMVRPEWSVRRAAMFMVRHGAEHTGQLIAYARMVGIVPPWTEEAQQRQRQQPAKQQ